MKLKRTKLFLSIIIIFIIMLAITFYQYKEYSTLTNNFISTVLEKINSEYPDIAIEDIIMIINMEDYKESSNILSSYGFSENDLSILDSFNKTFKENILSNSLLFVLLTTIILFGIYFYK